MSKAYYVDSFNIKSAHEQFNSSLSIICEILFEDVKFWTSKSSYDSFLKLTNYKIRDIEHSSLYVMSGEGKVSWIIRYLLSSIQNLRFLFLVPKDTILVFPFNNIFSLRILNFFNRFLKKRIVVFCHGEMEGLLGSTIHTGSFAKVLYKIQNNFFLNPKVKIDDKLFFAVFGDKIAENIGKLVTKDKLENFITIDHPYLFNGLRTRQNNSKKLNLGIVGVLNESKGANLFLSFTDSLKTRVKKNVNISAIGKVEIDIQKLISRDILFLEQDGNVISREIFDLKINELDFILFFYNLESYKITASGAIMDALNMEKPIIALKNDYFMYLFEKFGEFGYLFDNVNEMADVVEKISTGEIKNDFNFKEIKKNFSPESIAMQMKKELIRIKFIKEEN